MYSLAVQPLYYFCFGVFMFLLSPLLIFKKKARAGFSQKLGFVPDELRARAASLNGCLWFHSVSVGEFNALLPLLKEFKRLHPDQEVLVSTTTATGQALAKDKCKGLAEVIYFPYDLPFATASWLDLIKPSLVAIVETEIWPGFTFEAQKRGIKLAVVNGRMSPRSFKGYKRFAAFFSPVIGRFASIGVQSKEEAERYRALSQEARVEVLGNLKFDGLRPISPERKQALQESLGLGDQSFVFVAGSTHDGEEIACLNALSLLVAKQIKSRLIIVPRHPERFDAVERLIGQCGYKVLRHSRNDRFSGQENEVYLLDTIGKLFEFYSVADLAFVGGTIARVGGHNLMEPYAYAVPAIAGHHVYKTIDVCDSLLAAGAITLVEASELPALVLALAMDGEKRKAMGHSGEQVLLSSQGAVAKAVTMLESLLYNSGKSTK